MQLHREITSNHLPTFTRLIIIL